MTSTGYGSSARMPIGVALATRSTPAGSGAPARTRSPKRSRSRPTRASRRAGSASCRRSSATPASSRASAIADPAPPAPTCRARAPSGLAAAARRRRPRRRPGRRASVPSGLRRATLTEPRKRARSVRVAQCAASPNLCGTVAMSPATLADGLRPVSSASRSAGADLQRHDDGVAPRAPRKGGDAVRGLHLRDRVAEDRDDQGLAGQGRVAVHLAPPPPTGADTAACRAAT